MSSLTEAQITELSAYLSSPGLIPARAPSMTRPSLGAADAPVPPNDGTVPPSQQANASADPLRSIVIEGDLRREMLGNIAHHRSIGTYRGRRHAGGFPVRGQRTQSNGLTARRLNRLERRQYATGASALTMALRPLAATRFQI